MPGLLYSFNRDIFLKAALWCNTQTVFPASHSSPTRKSCPSKSLAVYPNTHCDFPPLCLSSHCAFGLEFTLLLPPSAWHFLPRSHVTFSLQSLWLAPGKDPYEIPRLPFSTCMLPYTIVILSSVIVTWVWMYVCFYIINSDVCIVHCF